LRAAKKGRLLRLTLDRPEKRNALNEATCRELVGLVEEAETDRSIGAVLLDAEGPAFCSGMDLEESLSPDAAARTAIHERLFTLGLRARKPIVAAVQGAALAGGTGLVANCHVVIAAEDSVFGLPEIRIGMWPMVVWRAVVTALGERRALELSLTGRRFHAAEALDWGLAHFVVPAGELAAKAAEVAQAIAEASPLATELGFTLLHEARGLNQAEAVKLAATLRARMFQAGDYAEGVRAFREKRAPRWPSLHNAENDP
jgi:enoyl-CoA hydratase/carnithine racemase